MRFVSCGVRISVTGDSAALLAATEPFLPPLRTPCVGERVERGFHVSTAVQPDGRPGFALRCGNRSVASSPELGEVLRALEWEVNLFLAQRAPGRIFVHAGAVGWKGKAIVVPGRSFSGKSTLVAELVRAGCDYLSDEFAVLDSRGACHAYPRNLSLRSPERTQRWAADAPASRTRSQPLPVGLVVVTRYRQGATWRPVTISSGEAVLALLENTVAARARARQTLAVLRAAVLGAEALAGERGDADQLVDALLASKDSVRYGI